MDFKNDMADVMRCGFRTSEQLKESAQVNRSTGTVSDYLSAISEGRTLESIGNQYGVTHVAVHRALQRAGLPTCALKYRKSGLGVK